MNDGLKQRIVGALVLVALGIIFIPVIFDKERIVPVDRTTQIPPEPDIVAIPLPAAPKPPRAKAEEIVEPISGSFEVADSEDRSAKADDREVVKNFPKSLAQTQAEASAWVLQVASYKDRSRAEALRDKLISQGRQAFVKTVNTDGGDRTRLYIGPTINKTDLEKTKLEIDKIYGVNSILARFKS